MNLIKNFSLTITSNILFTVLGLINNIIISRQIGVDGRGLYSVIMTFILFSFLILGDGIRRSSTFYASQSRCNPLLLSRNAIVVSSSSIVLLSILQYHFDIFSSYLPGIDQDYIYLAVVVVGLMTYSQSVQAIFLGLQKISIFNILMISTSLINVIINIFGILIWNFHLKELIYSYFTANLITSLFAFIKIENFENNKPKIENLRFISKLALTSKATISNLLVFIVLRGGILISNIYLSSVKIGLYSIAIFFFEMIQKIPNTIGSFVFSLTANDTSEENDLRTLKLIRAMFLLDTTAIIFLLILGRLLIVFLWGEEFAESIVLIYYMYPAFLFVGPSSVLYAYFMGKGYPIKVILLNLVTAFLLVIFIFFFIKTYKIESVAIITSLAISMWTIVLIIFFKHQTSYRFVDIFIITKSDITELSNGIKRLSGK